VRHLHTLVYCSTIHNISSGNSQDAPLPMNGLRKCGVYIKWNTIQPQRRMKFCYLQINGWNWEHRLKWKPKAACFPSYMEYRPNTNTAILWKTGHTKTRSHIRGVG
jgi:hypothetical protein